MEWHPTRWTAAQLEERRVAAARLLRAGRLTQAAIARRLGVSRAAVTQWQRRLMERGLRGVRRRAEALIEAWLKRDWPRIKRGRADLGAPSSSSTRRGTLSSLGWVPPGRRSAGHPSCGG